MKKQNLHHRKCQVQKIISRRGLYHPALIQAFAVTMIECIMIPAFVFHDSVIILNKDILFLHFVAKQKVLL